MTSPATTISPSTAEDLSVGTSSAGTSTPDTSTPDTSGGLASELRESVLLLGLAVAVTVGLTTAAQAALAAFG